MCEREFRICVTRGSLVHYSQKNEISESWKIIFHSAPTNVIKELALAVYEKSKGNSLRRYEICIYYPSYLVAEYGLTESCQYIVKNLPIDQG